MGQSFHEILFNYHRLDLIKQICNAHQVGQLQPVGIDFIQYGQIEWCLIWRQVDVAIH